MRNTFFKAIRDFFAFVTVFAVAGALLAQDDDAAGGIRVTTMLHDDGSKTVTKSDPANHTSEMSTFDAREKLKQRIVYTLDDRQQLKEGMVYAGNGLFQYKAVYTQDSAGRIQEEKDYAKDGRYLGRFVYRYGTNGKVLKIDAYDANDNLVSPNGAVPDQKHNRKRN